MNQFHDELLAVTVLSRIGDWKPQSAWLIDRVLMRDETGDGNRGGRRYFWLVDEGVQLVYEPFGWRDQWYIDIVHFDESPSPDGPLFRVVDEWIDLVIEGMGPTYRILDLDEFAAALTSNRLTVLQAEHALVCVQQFTDRYLHRGAQFPPTQILRFFSRDHDYPALRKE